jgi:hypothetical protein
VEIEPGLQTGLTTAKYGDIKVARGKEGCGGAL